MELNGRRPLTGFRALVLLLGLGLALQLATARPALAQTAYPPGNFLQAATVISEAIDRYEVSVVWDASSSIMKTKIPKDQFMASVAQKRSLLGSIQHRDWMAIMRVPLASEENGLPAGQYMSIRFATRGTTGQVMQEVISFRLESNNQWKLVGYTLE